MTLNYKPKFPRLQLLQKRRDAEALLDRDHVLNQAAIRRMEFRNDQRRTQAR